MLRLNKIDRRAAIAIMLFLGIGIDMLSTYLAVILKGGLEESTPLIAFFLQQSPLLLAVWIIGWVGGFYISYPVLKKRSFHIHAEVIAILMAVSSFLAAVSNFLLYFGLVA